MFGLKDDLKVARSTKENLERDLEASRFQENVSTEEIDSLKAEIEALMAEVGAMKTEASSRAHSTKEVRAAFLKTKEFKKITVR